MFYLLLCKNQPRIREINEGKQIDWRSKNINVGQDLGVGDECVP